MSPPAAPSDRSKAVVFVLASYRPDEPAGIERSVAARAGGIRHLGGTAAVITAAPQPCPDPRVTVLRSLPVTFPCDDATLRAAIDGSRAAVTAELGQALAWHRAGVVVYADALWGLGRVAAHVRHPARRVLAVHVIGHRADLAPALAAAHAVIAPSAAVIAEALSHGYDPSGWRVVPNPLLVDPDDIQHPNASAREQLRRHGPVAVIARLGAEKGVEDLLAAARPGPRPVHLILATAGFEAEPGSQQALLTCCDALARQAGAVLRPALPWHKVPSFLASAAVTIVPSLRETFGNIALESLSAGTPVVAYATGNLPALLGGTGAGILVPTTGGPGKLWESAAALLEDPLRYRQACGAAYCRSRNYRPATIADDFVKAVWQK